jgi:hypothetical protein
MFDKPPELRVRVPQKKEKVAFAMMQYRDAVMWVEI